jgi:hypothetical protein
MIFPGGNRTFLVISRSIPYAQRTMHVLRKIRISILYAALLFTPSIRAAQPIPAQLSDEAFWKLVTDSSEAGGGFISENLLSNELGYHYVIGP